MVRRKTFELVELSENSLETIKLRISSNALLEEDQKIVLQVMNTYFWIQHQLQSAKLTIHRLKKMFGFSSEKRGSAKESSSSGGSETPDPELAEGLTGTDDTENKQPKKKPVWDPAANHGRIGAAAYTGCEQVLLSNPLLAADSCCPDCAASNTVARLSPDNKPQFIIRLVGGPLMTGTRFELPVARCNLCQARFYTPVPEDIKNAPKYDISCASTLAIGRYFMGLPMYRTEQNQAMHGIPLPDSTQYDLIEDLSTKVSCVYAALTTKAANGHLAVYDDTPGRIVENKSKGLTTHTTAFITMHEEHKIHLFITGTNTAGRNVDAILSERTTDEPLTAMMDASPNNIPKKLPFKVAARFILCLCLVHGRRKFFEMFHFFEEQCDFVLDVIGQVFANDAHCKKEQLSAQDRLLYHQMHSKPLMDSLHAWLNNQLVYEQTESNSGLGQAVRYMLKHWKYLTTFLRVSGALLDSSWAERAIKIAIRHRRNSLFYRTTKGAAVGDCLMSLIYTAQQNGVNAFDYLNALQGHKKQVQASPEEWLPWNYRLTLSTIASPQLKVA